MNDSNLGNYFHPDIIVEVLLNSPTMPESFRTKHCYSNQQVSSDANWPALAATGHGSCCRSNSTRPGRKDFPTVDQQYL